MLDLTCTQSIYRTPAVGSCPLSLQQYGLCVNTAAGSASGRPSLLPPCCGASMRWRHYNRLAQCPQRRVIRTPPLRRVQTALDAVSRATDKKGAPTPPLLICRRCAVWEYNCRRTCEWDLDDPAAPPDRAPPDPAEAKEDILTASSSHGPTQRQTAPFGGREGRAKYVMGNPVCVSKIGYLRSRKTAGRFSSNLLRFEVAPRVKMTSCLLVFKK